METEEKYRIGAYVNRETWEKMNLIQVKLKAKTGKKPTQGEVIDFLVANSDIVYKEVE